MERDHDKNLPESENDSIRKWEYLIVKIRDIENDEHPHISVQGKKKYKGVFSGGEELNRQAKYYNEKLVKIIENEETASTTEMMNLLGEDGWELTTNVFSQHSSGKTYSVHLFFKKPVIASKE